MGKINYVGVVLVVLGLGLIAYADGRLTNIPGMPSFTVTQTFLRYFDFQTDETGSYVVSHPEETGWQNYYSAVAFVDTRAEFNGEPIALSTTPYTEGNGICGVFDCHMTAPNGRPIYVAVTGLPCATISRYKAFNRPEQKGTLNIDLYASWGAVASGDSGQALDALNQIKYGTCMDATTYCTGDSCHVPLHGVGSYQHTFTTGTEPQQPPVDTCGDGICGSSENSVSCPADCAGEPITNSGNMTYTILGVVLIIGGLYTASR